MNSTLRQFNAHRLGTATLRPITAGQVNREGQPVERGQTVSLTGGGPNECSFCPTTRKYNAPVTRDAVKILAERYTGPVPVYHDLCGLHMALYGIDLPFVNNRRFK